MWEPCRVSQGGAAHVAPTDKVALKRNAPPPPKEAWGGDPLKQGLPSLCMLEEVFIPTASRVSGLSREVTCLSLEHTAIIMEYSNQTAQRVIMENGFPFW